MYAGHSVKSRYRAVVALYSPATGLGYTVELLLLRIGRDRWRQAAVVSPQRQRLNSDGTGCGVALSVP